MDELTRLTLRVIELENRLNKAVDYSKVAADLHQKIFQLQQQLSGWEAVQKNVNDRLDAHGSDIAKLQNHSEKGIQFTPEQKPKRLWDILRGR